MLQIFFRKMVLMRPNVHMKDGVM